MEATKISTGQKTNSSLLPDNAGGLSCLLAAVLATHEINIPIVSESMGISESVVHEMLDRVRKNQDQAPSMVEEDVNILFSTELTAAGKNPRGFVASVDLDSAGASYREIAITLHEGSKAVGFVVVGLGGDGFEPVVHVSTDGSHEQVTHHVYPLRKGQDALVIDAGSYI